MSTPKGGRITADDIYKILRQHIESRDPAISFLAEIEIDPQSLIIEGKTSAWTSDLDFDF